MFTDRRPYKSRPFLSWAKSQGGRCCVCWQVDARDRAASELHHYGPKGMGQKGSDLLVARVCIDCHSRYQGKRRIAFERSGELHVLEALEADNIELLAGYVEHIESLTRPAITGKMRGHE